ncbi:MAG: hypothetical protein Q8L90_07085, partial [Bacteroidota bacterium]|nr:hypothetical protein [Bacteroidota bacterium]
TLILKTNKNMKNVNTNDGQKSLTDLEKILQNKIALIVSTLVEPDGKLYTKIIGQLNREKISTIMNIVESELFDEVIAKRKHFNK